MHAFYVRAGEHSLFTCCYVREKETDRKRVVQQVDDAESVTLEPPSRRGRVHLLHRRRRRRRHVLAARNVDASRPVRLRRRHLPASSSFVTRRDAGRRPLSRYRGARSNLQFAPDSSTAFPAHARQRCTRETRESRWKERVGSIEINQNEYMIMWRYYFFIYCFNFARKVKRKTRLIFKTTLCGAPNERFAECGACARHRTLIGSYHRACFKVGQPET